MNTGKRQQEIKAEVFDLLEKMDHHKMAISRLEQQKQQLVNELNELRKEPTE